MSTHHADNINDIHHALDSEIFESREAQKIHAPYSQELRYLSAIKNGDPDLVSQTLFTYSEEGTGRMSLNPMRQQMYAFVASITMVTRFAIEGGLAEEEAYYLSDIYIQKADLCTNPEDIWKIHRTMALDFANKVRTIKEKKKNSAPIQLAEKYIFSHLHYQITISELAAYVGLSKNYLCALFKQETGETITEFIHKKRITEAKSLLRYSEYSISEISQYLGFCSQSHFTHIFRKYIGMTPMRFRRLYFSRNWE